MAAAAALSHQHNNYPQNRFHCSTSTRSSDFSSHHHHHHYSSSSSSSSTLMMNTTKTLIHTLIYTQLLRLHRALTNAKSHVSRFISRAKHAKNKYEHKLRLGSFRLHYNWSSSSRVMPAAAARSSYHPSTWNISATDSSGAQLTGYLQWLEDHKKEEVDDYEEQEEERFYSARHDDEDVDKLAELFIASGHEKFLLEKQESYRRFQDMLARSV